MQQIFYSRDGYEVLDGFFEGEGPFLLVHGNSLRRQPIWAYLQNLSVRLGKELISFTDFSPNPQYESVVKGRELFAASKCRGLVAVGGGSAIDVAKAIKLMAIEKDEREIPFLAVPTTAGTGSEITRFAVVYRDGKKESWTDEKIIPDAVLFAPELLASLPTYHKKAALLDALSHGIEATWSVNSTEESREYSRTAIKLILANTERYLAGEKTAAEEMLRAANLAGRAINITQTTAGHAMCYKLTSLFGLAHGHAAALCVASLWEYMAGGEVTCLEPRGRTHLDKALAELKALIGGPKALAQLIVRLNMEFTVKGVTEAKLDFLTAEVNPVRLRNHPVELSPGTIKRLYENITRFSHEM